MLRREKALDTPFRIITRHYLCSNRGVKVQFFQFSPPPLLKLETGRVQRDSHGRKSEGPCVTKAVPFESFAFHFRISSKRRVIVSLKKRLMQAGKLTDS